MKRAVLFAAVALLTFAACGSDSSSGGPKSTTTVKRTTTTTAKKGAGKAVTIAKQLGCTNPKTSKPGNRFGLPQPNASVTCTAKGVVYHVDVYANHAAVLKLFDADGAKATCVLRKALKLTGARYAVSGADFIVTANPPAVKKVPQPGTLAAGEGGRHRARPPGQDHGVSREVTRLPVPGAVNRYGRRRACDGVRH